MNRPRQSLPRGLRHPESFRRFAEPADQDSDTYGSFDNQLNAMYGNLHAGEPTNSAWLRRGDEVISFLEHALEGPYTDQELATMWLTSGAQTYFPAKHVRFALSHMLDRVREFQEQNKAGTFVSYWSTLT